MRIHWLLAGGLAAAFVAGPSSAQVKGFSSPAVLDLRVGIARSMLEGTRADASHRQAGLPELHRGRVEGVLLPFAVNDPGATAERAALAFAKFRSALSTTQGFDTRGCAATSERITTWFELQAAALLVNEPGQVPAWVARGIRVFALVGRHDNRVATSAFAGGPESPLGLSAAGRRLVEEILAAGALLDVSNLSDTAFVEAVELARSARAPVLATRASARAVLRRPGSLSDAQLRAIAQTGGVVAIGFERELLSSRRTVSMADVIRQIEHVQRVAGPAAVAIGSGFETGIFPPTELSSAAQFPGLADALDRRGMSGEAIRGLVYENARRVLCAPAAVVGQRDDEQGR